MAIYKDIEDKKILVTGATRGIGKGICKALAENKAHIVMQYRKDRESVQKFANELESMGGKVTLIEFDLSNYDQMKQAISDFDTSSGVISGLVNNAGISQDQLVMRLKPDDIDKVLSANLKGAMLLSGLLSRQFLKAENVSIVNVSSIVGLMGNPGQTAYAASKAGLIGFSKSIAKELASRNIRSNAICPGFITTDMTDDLDEKTRQSYLDSIPLKKMGEVSDVANLVLFLLSQSSSYITGEVIKIDGGLYI